MTTETKMSASSFSPSAWLGSRKRLQSQSSAENSSSASLRGLKYSLSQPPEFSSDFIQQGISWQQQDADIFSNPPIPKVKNSANRDFHRQDAALEFGNSNSIHGQPFIVRQSIPLTLNRNSMRSSTPDSETASLPRNPSGDCNSSIISGLSADEGSTAFDESRKIRLSSAHPTHRPKNRIPDARRPHSADEAPISGRDFGDVFNHLIVRNVDLLNDDSCNNQSMHSMSRTLERPKPLHSRATSDNSAFRSIAQQDSFSHHQSSKSSLPAHATLRECIDTMKAGEASFRVSKPHMLQSRSTSSTVFSSNATTTSGASGGVVWTGQMPIELSVNSPKRSSQHLHTGAYHPFIEHEAPVNHGLIHHRSESGFSFASENTPDYSLAIRSSGNSSKSTPVFPRDAPTCDGSMVQSLQSLALEDQSHYGSMGGVSIDSRMYEKPARSRKPSVKDEFKFILGKVVPSPLKKVSFVKEKVKLERSNGCLT